MGFFLLFILKVMFFVNFVVLVFFVFFFIDVLFIFVDGVLDLVFFVVDIFSCWFFCFVFDLLIENVFLIFIFGKDIDFVFDNKLDVFVVLLFGFIFFLRLLLGRDMKLILFFFLKWIFGNVWFFLILFKVMYLLFLVICGMEFEILLFLRMLFIVFSL